MIKLVKKIIEWRYVCVKYISPLLVLIILPFPPINLSSEEIDNYREYLIKTALAKELYNERYWHLLLHYKETLFGVESIVDDPRFFKAENGKINPKEELIASINLFFNDSPEKNNEACGIIARYEWLKEELNIDPAKLPNPVCSKFYEKLDEIRPESVILIYPGSHINSPASMFGHTLLVIETENKSRLLAHAVNYAAITTDSSGPLFAFKGIFGLYKGYYSVLPYYMKVQEYSDLNYRDIWEYELNLTKKETTKMMLHLLEMENIYSDYYFFDENCAYFLLDLLEVARPTINLTNDLKPWVVPVDTIRAIEREKLIKRAVYRPSRVTKINYLDSLLEGGKRDLIKAVVNDELDHNTILSDDKITPDDKIRFFDLSIEYLQFMYSRRNIEQEEYQKRYIKILKSRSTLGALKEDQYDIPIPTEPLKSHKSGRININAGFKDKDWYQEIIYRGVYHEFIDSEEGYIESGQIIFGKGSARYFPLKNKLYLEYFEILNIQSITPINKYYKAFSWKAKTGIAQKDLQNDKRDLVYYLNLGGGGAVKTFFGQMYLMPGADFITGRKLDSNYALGAGASFGLINRLTSFWKIYFVIDEIYYALGDVHNFLKFELQQNFQITTNNSIMFTFSASRAYDFWKNDISIGWNLYH